MEAKKTAKDDSEKKARQRAHDKIIADSFPTSDPPSSIPDPLPESPGSAIERDDYRDEDVQLPSILGASIGSGANISAESAAESQNLVSFILE